MKWTTRRLLRIPSTGDTANLAALRLTSVHADDACEPSNSTARAIPSYTLGRVVADIRYQDSSDLLLKVEGTDQFVSWRGQRTLFHEAASAGRITAIIGYFHPYCRLFGSLTKACQAFPHPEAGELMKWWSTLQAQPLNKAVVVGEPHPARTGQGQEVRRSGIQAMGVDRASPRRDRAPQVRVADAHCRLRGFGKSLARLHLCPYPSTASSRPPICPRILRLCASVNPATLGILESPTLW